MRTLAIALVVVGAVLGLSGTVTAQTATSAPVNVVQVSGYLDRVEVDYITKAISEAQHDGAQALVLQMNSSRAVVSSSQVARLAERIAASPVPVAIWVGPSGARAYGGAGRLLASAAITGMAPGARIGKFGSSVSSKDPLNFGAATDRLQTESMSVNDAVQAGALKAGPGEASTPTLPLFILGLDGFHTKDGKVLSTVKVVQTANGPRQENSANPRFFKLPIGAQLMHTAASPPVAYLLLVIGLLLLVFEFFTAGVGVAGVVGAICLVLACYGVAALPTRHWAVALLILSAFAFAVDVQTAVPRFWTGVGITAFTLGSLWMWDGVHMSWLPLAAGIGGMLLAVLSGMPSMVRSRFATPTIGREWMIGEMGEAVTSVDPDGTVKVRDALWRAHTNRATPLAVGDRIKVVAIDGVMLEVAPEVGGARDYRERRPKTAE